MTQYCAAGCPLSCFSAAAGCLLSCAFPATASRPGGGLASFHSCCRTRGSILLAAALEPCFAGGTFFATQAESAAAAKAVRVRCTPLSSRACEPAKNSYQLTCTVAFVTQIQTKMQAATDTASQSAERLAQALAHLPEVLCFGPVVPLSRLLRNLPIPVQRGHLSWDIRYSVQCSSISCARCKGSRQYKVRLKLKLTPAAPVPSLTAPWQPQCTPGHRFFSL